MGVSIPQVVTETKASGAQVIDGSLTIESSKSQFLSRLPASSGNRKTWTWSCWVKKPQDEGFSDSGVLFEARLDSPSADADIFGIRWLTDGKIGVYDTGTFYIQGTREFRDTSAWYHLVLSVDTTQASNNLSLYVNGDLYLQGSYAQNTDTRVNDTTTHRIGARTTLGGQDAHFLSSQLSQIYLIDGQALGPESFGYTDGLTNTWRPKKYEGTFTQTSFNNGTTWSSSLTSNVTLSNAGNAFDGDLSSRAQTTSAAADNTLTFSPPAINFTQSLEVYCDQGSAVPTATWNGNTVNPGGGAWVTVYTGSGTLSSTYPLVIDTETASQYATLKGVRIDGEVLIDGLNGSGVNSFYLPMDGNSPIGEDKSGIVTINDGRLWSASVSGGIGPYTNGFDGSLSSYMYPRNQNAEGNLVFAGGLPCDAVYCNTYSSSGTEFFTDSASSPTSVNTSSSFAWVELPADATVLNEIKGTGGAGYDAFAIAAFRKNGTILLDGIKGNSWTPVNFGGSVALDNPIVSGARPILNTDGGGKTARPGVFGSEVGAYYAVTVSNPGSGNKYYFDTVLTPTPTFYRGSTYTFDYTAATSHPLYLSALSDGKHNSKAYSVQFDGTGDYLTLAQSNDFDLTGDYTYEAFIYYTDTTNNPTIFDFSAASGNYEGRLQIQAGTLHLYNSGWISKGAISANTWHHIAVTQDFIFVDGVNIGSGTGAISGSNYKVVTIGARTNNGGTSYGDYFTGYISNVRIVNGTALYTENFTVPTTTLTNVTNTKLLCCQDNNATTAVVAPGGITAVGNAAASNTYNPFVYNIDNYFGVDASTSNVTKQVIPHSAVDTLYYFCNIHSGMGGSANIVTDETKADPYAWKNTLATPLVGSANDISNSVNSGSTTKTATVTNANASSAQSNFYNGSFDFDGSGDYISYGTSSEMDFGSGDCTVECWLYINSHSADKTIVGSWEGNISWQLSYGSDSGNDKFAFMMYNGSTTSANSSLLSTNYAGQWVHLAGVRNGNELQIWVNGKKDGTASFSGAHNALNSAIRVGGRSGGNQVNAHIQDVRIYKGVAKYTSDFVVPSTNPDILPDTPSGVSGGSKLTKITEGAVSFDGSGDYLNVDWSSDFEFGTGDFTIEYYGYWNTSGTSIAWGQTIDERFDLGSLSAGSVRFFCRSSASTFINISADIAPSKWSHIAAVREGTAFRLYIDGKLGASGTASDTMPNDSSRGVDIGRRRYSTSDSTYTNGFISNLRVIKGTALYTSDFTPPSAPLTNVTNTKLLCCQSNTSAGAASVSPNISGINDGTVWSSYISGNVHATNNAENTFDGNTNTRSIGASAGDVVTFTPPSTISISSGLRVFLWKNTSGDSWGTFTINGSTVNLNSLGATHGAWYDFGTTYNSSGLTSMSWENDNGSNIDVRVAAIEIDGTVLLDPVTVRGNAAATNFNPFNTDINTVRGQETGYCTWNPLCSSSNTTLSNGNLDMSSGAAWDSCIGTIGATSGKYYWEQTMTTNQYTYTGFCNQNFLGKFESHWPGQTVDSWSYLSSNGLAKNDQSGGSEVSVTLTTMPSSGGILGFALDLDNQKAWFALNGKWMGSGSPNPATGTDAVFTNLTAGDTYFPAADVYSASASFTFGQKPFKFPPPDGFQPLNNANVRPETVIVRPDQYVGVTTWSGNSGDGLSTTQDINVGLKPDLIWIKHRNGTNSNLLTDTVRGLPNTLISNSTAATNTNASRIPALLDNGFRVGDRNEVNDIGGNYVAWTWRAGGNKNTFNIDDVGYASAAAAGLDGGNKTPTGASVGTKQGFSIIKYDGAGTSTSSTNTISHGLSQAPTFLIVKAISGTNAADDWFVYHKDIGATKRIRLNLTNAADTQPWLGNPGTLPTSSLVTITQGWYSVNYSGHTHIMYAWHDVPGLQKFGSYTGNSSTDGPVVITGFKPALVILKAYVAPSTTVTSWVIQDSERGSYNVINSKQLYANRNYAEGLRGDGSATNPQRLDIDFLSNGFKLRDIGNEINATGYSYIYAAWAEAPTFNLYGAQSNAR